MEIDKTVVLSNGVEMPRLIQGVPHCDQWTNYSVDFFYDILRTSVRNVLLPLIHHMRMVKVKVQ